MLQLENVTCVTSSSSETCNPRPSTIQISCDAQELRYSRVPESCISTSPSAMRMLENRSFVYSSSSETCNPRPSAIPPFTVFCVVDGDLKDQCHKANTLDLSHMSQEPGESTADSWTVIFSDLLNGSQFPPRICVKPIYWIPVDWILNDWFQDIECHSTTPSRLDPSWIDLEPTRKRENERPEITGDHSGS